MTGPAPPSGPTPLDAPSSHPLSPRRRYLFPPSSRPFSRRAGGKPPPRAAQRKPPPPFPQPHAPFSAARTVSPAPKPRCLDPGRTTQTASPFPRPPAPSLAPRTACPRPQTFTFLRRASKKPFPPVSRPFPHGSDGKPRLGLLGASPRSFPPTPRPFPRRADGMPPPPDLHFLAPGWRRTLSSGLPPLPADLPPLAQLRGRQAPDLHNLALSWRKALPACLSPLASRLGRQAPPWAARRKPPPLSAGLPPLPSPRERQAPAPQTFTILR